MKYCPDCKLELITQVIDAVDRMVCIDSQCGFIFWNNPITVVVALVQLGDRYIIARNSQWPEHQYSFISGYVDPNDTLEQTAVREVYEELGLDAKILSYLGSYSFPEKNQLIVAYSLSANGEINLNAELAAVKLLSKKELQQYNFAEFEITRSIIEDWAVLGPC